MISMFKRVKTLIEQMKPYQTSEIPCPLWFSIGQEIKDHGVPIIYPLLEPLRWIIFPRFKLPYPNIFLTVKKYRTLTFSFRS